MAYQEDISIAEKVQEIVQLRSVPFSKEGLALITKAYEFAEAAHKDHKRYSGEPYMIHLHETAKNLSKLGMGSVTVAAGLLHDVLEDTGIEAQTLKNAFDDEIVSLVEGVTKLDKIRYKGTERSAESLRKMFLAIAEDMRVVLLKLVDRLHNMETLRHLPPEKQKRISLETLEIYAPLAYRLGIKELSGKLEDLAFPYVYPREYEWLMQAAKREYKDWETYAGEVKPLLARELTEEKISFLDIHARAKHYYSLYKKLLKYDMDISKITDIVALRVIVPTIEDCYATLGAIHKLWRPLPGKIKDYIALPKPNGYRSLHTTVFGPKEWHIEIQMRTPEMHEEAEYGIAAHWAYAELKRRSAKAYADHRPSFITKKQFAWLGQIREWQKDFENPDEFLESLKIDFFRTRIFVLTPKGDVIDLPEGATPIDFAYQVHTDIGNTAIGAKVNGKMVALDYLLKNGEVVEVLTQKNKKPSRDWLGVVKSGQARKKIAGALKKLMEERSFETRRGEITEMHITARDRIGLLRDISHIFARNKINIRSNVSGPKNQLWASFTIQATFKNRTELERLMVRLREIKGVNEVGYRLL